MKKLLLLTLLGACAGADDGHPDAGADGIDARATPDAGPAPLTLAINEVAAAGVPNDWFEVVNTGDAPLTLSDFQFADSGGVAMAAAFAEGNVLAPGSYFVQEVTDAGNGFKLASDEELHVYRGADGTVSDEVDWVDADSPAGGSYARVPDTTGAFQTVTPDTRGVANQ